MSISFGDFDKTLGALSITPPTRILEDFFSGDGVTPAPPSWKRFILARLGTRLASVPTMSFPNGFILATPVLPIPTNPNNETILGDIVVGTAWAGRLFPRPYVLGVPHDAHVYRVHFAMRRMLGSATSARPVTLKALKSGLTVFDSFSTVYDPDYDDDLPLDGQSLEEVLDVLRKRGFSVNAHRLLRSLPVSIKHEEGDNKTVVEILDIIERKLHAFWYWCGDEAYIDLSPITPPISYHCTRRATDLSDRGQIDGLSVVEP